MADIFDEIDEDLKRDRTEALWTKYGKYVIAAAAAVVLGVGASQGFSAWTRSQDEAAANLYQQSLAADDAVAALEQNLGQLTDGYALLGRFQIAAGLAEAGDAAAAEAGYLAIAEDASAAPLYRDAALLLSAMNAPDTRPAGDLQTRIAPLADGTGPWKAMALELSAALDLQDGNRDAALSKLETIIELAEVSAELRQRAARLVNILKS
tara:strand:+ start:126 stop:752 length:627 start_codon:yes stop_codon:yes gene_type:complete